MVKNLMRNNIRTSSYQLDHASSKNLCEQFVFRHHVHLGVIVQGNCYNAKQLLMQVLNIHLFILQLGYIFFKQSIYPLRTALKIWCIILIFNGICLAI